MMGKNKPAQEISAKKTLKKVVALQLVKQLTDITGKISAESKGLTKAIEKGAKKLAKKISKEIKPIHTNTSKPAEVNTKPAAGIAATKPVVKNAGTAKPAVTKAAIAKKTPAPVTK